MPSLALLHWRTERAARLDELDVQCVNCQAAQPPSPYLVDENLRGYCVLLSAHFQGFARDLYRECAQVVVSKVRARLQMLIQNQFFAHCAIDRGNPNYENLKKDFNRLGLKLDLPADPGNRAPLQSLAELNEWRNVAAHQLVPPSRPLSLGVLRTWRGACDQLATALDGAMYNHLKADLRRAPWAP